MLYPNKFIIRNYLRVNCFTKYCSVCFYTVNIVCQLNLCPVLYKLELNHWLVINLTTLLQKRPPGVCGTFNKQYRKLHLSPFSATNCVTRQYTDMYKISTLTYCKQTLKPKIFCQSSKCTKPDTFVNL